MNRLAYSLRLKDGLFNHFSSDVNPTALKVEYCFFMPKRKKDSWYY